LFDFFIAQSSQRKEPPQNPGRFSLGLSNTVKRTRKREFLDAMELVVPWAELVALIEPYAPESGRRGQQPFAVQAMLRIHFMQQWFKLSDPAMEEALHDVPAFRDFAGLTHWDEQVPSESAFCDLGICWSAISWPHRSWPRSMRCCKPRGCSSRRAPWWMPR